MSDMAVHIIALLTPIIDNNTKNSLYIISIIETVLKNGLRVRSH
jgi:hypothetical protein